MADAKVLPIKTHVCVCVGGCVKENAIAGKLLFSLSQLIVESATIFLPTIYISSLFKASTGCPGPPKALQVHLTLFVSKSQTTGNVALIIL